MEHLSLDRGEQFALELDGTDQLAGYRQRFYITPPAIYMDGNSLGLLSVDAERAVLGALDEWKRLGIGGWLGAEIPWFHLAERLGELMSPMMGAAADELVVSGSTTVNLHQLVATFYRPRGARYRILADELNFPSDIYALRSQAALQGYGQDAVVLVHSRDGRTLDEQDLIEQMTDDAAIAVLPGVLYRSGQLLDIGRIAAAARERGIICGFDLSHSAGSVPHRLDEWGVDFAFWCTYKHLNAGPGSVAAMYVNRRHFERDPGLAGWWGMRKDRQFRLELTFEPAAGAGAWQIGTPCILGMAALRGSLEMINDAGIDRIRAKSLKLTDYLIALVDRELSRYGYGVGTPVDHEARGGHVAVEHEHAAGICDALRARGVIPDFRPPNVIRLAPIALYSTFHEVWRVVGHLRDIAQRREYEAYADVIRQVT